jgi:ABC-type Na+ efflux pump permease subunit
MIWKIARKEILSNIMTMRFTVGTVLFLILIVVFTYVLINDYQQKLEDNNELVARNSESFGLNRI